MGGGEGGVTGDSIPKSRVVGEVALFSALIIVTRMFKLHLHIPGSGSMPWIALLIIARGISRYSITSTLIGVVVGSLVTVSGLDIPPGPHQFIKYVIAGASVDALGAVMRRFPNQLTYALSGIAAGLSKMFSVYLIAAILSIPVFIVKAVLAYVAGLNAVFGCVAGVMAFYIVKAVTRVRGLTHGNR